MSGAQEIAVIGMAGRFPGAADVEAFWRSLCDGTESIARFGRDELLAMGRDPAVVDHPRFVGAEGVLAGIESFDAAFFGYSPREAEVMDPQHRLCLETAWQVFDGVGYDPAAIDGAVGVFLSASLSSYLIRNLLPDRELLAMLGGFPLLIHNDKDFLATTVSHKLGLRGPSMAIGTACSSSLVAVHLACQSLQTFESDLALAGGVSLQVPQPQGYVHSDDGVYSPDGHCRAFDAAAGGTVGGSGVGLVLLKRLADARRDGDHVHAVILGTAVNNDGAAKQGYTAPGVDGQTAVIVEAHEVAGVLADEFGYVEAHGTGTRLGDPVEIEALTRAFRRTTARRRFCAVGSVKTNVGHLDAAAGVASLIKAVLAVERGVIPASLHYERPNPHIDFESSPFFVNAATGPWRGGSGGPRTAGVSAFGIGGTNAHVVLRQATAAEPDPRPSRPWQPLLLSARDDATLDRAAHDLATHLRRDGVAHPRPDDAAYVRRDGAARLADVARTLAGRRALPRRRALVCADTGSAAAALSDAATPSGIRPRCDISPNLLAERHIVTPAEPGWAGTTAAAGVVVDLVGTWDGQPRPVVFLLPGQGAQHAGMGVQLYRDEPVFRQHLDACAELLAGAGIDLHAALAAPAGPEVVQPALFAVEYAVARTLQDWGLRPAALVGHSLGEYVAATLAGVFSLDDALRLVCARGRLHAELPAGAMLAVPCAWAEVASLALDAGLDLAADNGPGQCVIAGPPGAIEGFEAALAGLGVPARRLPGGRAYHSAAVDALTGRFHDAVRAVELHPPRLPLACNLTGDWATGEIAKPEYWVRHLRETVRFGPALRTVLAQGPAVLLDVGPSTVLGPLAARHPARTDGHTVLACQPRPGAAEPQPAALISAVAGAWVAGATVDWPAFFRAQRGARTPCPPYPFNRRRFWIDPPATDRRPPAPPAPAAAPTPAAVNGPSASFYGHDGSFTPSASGGGDGAPRAFEEFVAAVRRDSAERAVADPVRGIDEYPGLRAGLDALCSALALRYLADVGIDTRPGVRHERDRLAEVAGVLPGYRRFLDYLLAMLAEDGVLRVDESSVVFLDPTEHPEPASVRRRCDISPIEPSECHILAESDVPTEDGAARDGMGAAGLGHGPGRRAPVELARRLTERHPEFAGLIDLLVHCAGSYPGALSRRGAGLGVLYPDGTGDLLRRTLGEQTVEHLHTGHAASAVAELAADLARAAGRPLRVLEVGAGGGRLTRQLVEALRDVPADVLVTDISRLFVEHLATALHGVDFVRTATLDISRGPAAQGFTEGGFDLIAGLDVVHATPDVRASIANLRSLLGPAGVLALVETTAPDRWQSMIWGLSEDWWTFADDLRAGQPLLAPDGWAAALTAGDFAASAVLPFPQDTATPDTALVLARAPSAAPAPTANPAPSATLAPSATAAPSANAASSANAAPSANGAGAPARLGRAPSPLGELPPKRPDLGEWLYLPSWIRAAPPSQAGAVPGGCCLVFSAGALGAAVASRLRERGVDIEVVRQDGHLDQRAYRDLLDGLAAAGRPVSHVVHAWGADPDPAAATAENLDGRLLRGLHSLLLLAQAAGAQRTPALRRVLAVTAGAHDVLGADLHHPEQAMLDAAVKVIPREYPDVACGAVDVPVHRTEADTAWLADRLVDELFAEPSESEVGVAYRGRHRWLPTFTAAGPTAAAARPPAGATRPPTGPTADAAARPRAGGSYLITGGLGGIGLALGEHLARLPATVVLTTRRAFPDRDEWDALPDGPDSATVRRLLAMEAAGGRVVVATADVTSHDQMRTVVERFGPFTGVVHAAGVTDQAGMIQRRTVADTDRAIDAKVRGALVLDRVLDGHPLDFFAMCSSLGPILYKLKFGEVGYVASNEFCNAFAAYRAARGHAGTVAISWTDWLEAGMWARARERLDEYELSGLDTSLSDDLLRGITEAEGVEVFRRIIGAAAGPNVIVSTQDLHALLAHHDAFSTAAHRELVDRLRLTPGSRGAPRREPGGERPLPATPTEAMIAQMWQALLGVEAVGPDDSFFELGGDSLLALRFLSQLRDGFGVEHPIARMFDAPTVRAIAAEVELAGGDRAAAGEEEVLL